MEKLKHVLSHGHRKSVGATHKGEISSPTGQNRRAATAGVLSGEGAYLESVKATSASPSICGGYHPIYDRFTGQSRPTTAREPMKATDQVPHFSNSPTLNNPPGSAEDLGSSGAQAESATSSSPRPETTRGRLGNMTDRWSTASIRSGVIGFPQGKPQHAALQNNPAERGLDATRTEGVSTLPDRTAMRELKESPHLGRDATVGAGSIGAGTAAAHELHHQPHHDNLRAPEQTNAAGTMLSVGQAPQQPFENPFQEPTGTTVTDRSFPLAGGVTSRKQADNPSAIRPTQPHAPATNKREPGTKDKGIGLSDSRGRGALAGAAAAYSALPPLSEHTPQQYTQEASGFASGAYMTPTNELPVEREQAHEGPARAALAEATIASSAVPSSEKEHKHEQTQQGMKSSIDPCASDALSSAQLFSSGPHATDTMNRLDPYLHIPGEFPKTPMETASERDRRAEGYVTESARQPEARAAESSTQPQTDDKQCRGHGAAIAGAGATRIDVYSATKRHQSETADVEGETTPTEASPYSSMKLDPRVDANPAGFEEQRFDPAAWIELPPHETQREAVPSTRTATAPTSQIETGQSLSEGRNQHRQNKHHYGRDARLVFAGTATTGALPYASQCDKKLDFGHASATIGSYNSNVANIVDPGVNPYLVPQRHHQASPTPEGPATRTAGPHKSDVGNTVDPSVQSQHEKQKGHITTGPHKSDTLNPLDSGVYSKAQSEDQPHLGRGLMVIGSADAATYGAYEAAKTYDQHRSTQPAVSMDDQRCPTAQGAQDPNQAGQQHHGWDSTIGGGLGAVNPGILAYEGSKRADKSDRNPPLAVAPTQPPQTTTQPQAHQESVQHAGHQRYDSVQDPIKQHYEHGMAAAGMARADASFTYSQQKAKEEEERLAEQKFHAKELEHQQKEQQKGFKKKQKELERAFQERQKEVDKQQSKEQKRHKLVTAGDKVHQKEVEKEAERAEEKDEGKGKKHHLFGFLHRDKDKKQSPKGSLHQSKESPRHLRESAGAANSAMGTACEGEHEGRNRLHKDLPKERPAREARGSGKREHVGIGGPTSRPDQISGDHGTRAGVYGDCAVDDQYFVIEPHTGLPMDIEKYGGSYGGTNGSKTIEEYHQVPGAYDPFAAGGQHSVTD